MEHTTQVVRRSKSRLWMQGVLSGISLLVLLLDSIVELVIIE